MVLWRIHGGECEEGQSSIHKDADSLYSRAVECVPGGAKTREDDRMTYRIYLASVECGVCSVRIPNGRSCMFDVPSWQTPW